MTWIKQKDPCLTIIMVTADGEKKLVASALRIGAFDFLEKPIDLEALYNSVTQAVTRTSRLRQMTKSEASAKELGRMQEWMLDIDEADSPVRINICFHPKHEAGGDFFSRLQHTPDRILYLLTDVSGHDLQAAYISAYFQGLVRGMFDREASVPEILANFNDFLLDDWNEPKIHDPKFLGISASVAVCAILIDLKLQTVTVLTQGTPAPIYFSPDGNAQIIGRAGGFPLGWFPEFSIHTVSHPFNTGDSLCLWTDGLEDLSEKAGVSALSLSYALQRAKMGEKKNGFIDYAMDDILVADIHLFLNDSNTDFFYPLIVENYSGEKRHEIDEFQAFWRRSLILAVTELAEDRLNDILLASREALLNALIHGCQGRADQINSFQIAYSPSCHTIRVRVSDPGPGHNFNITEHEQLIANELVGEHLGLILIKNLASKVISKNNGASLTMDFA